MGNSYILVMQGLMNKLMKNMQKMSTKMSQIVRKVEQLEIDKLKQASSNLNNIKGILER